MKLLALFFLSHGRIARATWLARLAALVLCCSAFGLLAQELAGEVGAALLAAVFVWSAASLSIQRLHDMGRSGGALLLLVIPVLGPLWVLLLLLRRGGEGGNRYGRDPLARLDYLQVDVSR